MTVMGMMTMTMMTSTTVHMRRSMMMKPMMVSSMRMLFVDEDEADARHLNQMKHEERSAWTTTVVSEHAKQQQGLAKLALAKG